MSAFTEFWALGYHALLPITPPGASPLYEHSKLKNRPDTLGKVPGILNRNGEWCGINLTKTEATEESCALWAAMGCGVGLKTGTPSRVVAVDIDTLDEDYALQIATVAYARLGPALPRIGRAPKLMLLYRCDERVAFFKTKFDGADGQRELVELAIDGRQVIIAGIHPKTMRPYEWPGGVPAFADLTVVTPEQLEAFFRELATILPNGSFHGAKSAEPGASEASPAALVGRLEDVTRAVAALPNTIDSHPTRDDWLNVGYAIKAALPDDPAEALEIFQNWSEKYDADGGNDPAYVEDEWSRLVGPFRRGAGWLYEQAQLKAPESFQAASLFFEPISAEECAAIETSTQISLPELEFRQPYEWVGEPLPVRKWIAPNMIPDENVTMLTGEGGVGKSLLAQQISTAIACGLPVLGQPIEAALPVLMIMCEDDYTELHIRQMSIQNQMGAVPAPDMMRIISRKGEDNLLSAWNRNENKMTLTPFWHAVAAAIVKYRPKLVTIDTAADTFGGNEIDRQQVRQFVQACLLKLAISYECAVMLLAHPSKSGAAKDGDGTSGSTAWHGSVRARWYLTKTGKAGGGDRLLKNMKSNYGPDGSAIKLRIRKGQFDLLSATVGQADEGDAPAALLGVPTNEKAARDHVLAALMLPGMAETSLNPASPRANNYAARLLCEAHSPLSSFGVEVAAEALADLISEGLVAVTDLPFVRNGTKNRKGLRVVGAFE